MADLSDIQLRIIVEGTGLDNITKLNTALGLTTGASKNAGAAAGTAAGKFETWRQSISDLERNMDAIFRAASHLQALGSDLTGMGSAGLGVLKKVVDVWGDFEFALNRASGALGIFDTMSPIYKQLQDGINAVAQEVRVFPATEVAQAIYYWGSATGQVVRNTKDLAIVTGGVIPILKAAAITHTNMEDAIKGVYQVLVQYHLPLTKAADVTEKLMLVAQKTANEFPDLINAFKMAGAVAPSLGITFEDMAIIMGRLGDMGIRGGLAGRALAQVIVKLVDPTVKAKKALDDLFMSTEGLHDTFSHLVFPNGKFVGTTKYIDLMAQATQNMTMEERGHLMGVITTQNGLRALLPLINDQIRARKKSSTAIDAEKYSLAKAHVQFEATFNLLKNSWKGVMGLISTTIAPIIQMIGSTVARMAAPFLEKFAQMLIGVKKFLDTHPLIVEWGVKLLAVASIVAIVLGSIFTFVGVLLAFGAGIMFVVGALGLLVGMLTGVGTAVALVSGVIAGLATIWTKDLGGIREAVGRVVDAFGNLWNKLNFTGAKGGFSMLMDLKAVVLPVLTVVAKAAAFVLNKIADALNWIAGNKTATFVLQKVVDLLIILMTLNAGLKLVNIGLGMASMAGKATGALLPLRLLKVALNGVFNIKATAGKTIDAIKGIGSAAAGAAGSVVTNAKNMGGAMVVLAEKTGIATLATKLFGVAFMGIPIIGWIAAIIAIVGLLYVAWINNFGGIQQKVGAVVDFIVEKFNQFVGFFSNLPANLGKIWTDITTTISTKVGEIVTFVTGLPGKIWDGIAGGFATLLANITTWWTSLGDSTAERIGFIVGFAIALPVRIAIEFIKKFGEIHDWMVNWLGGILKNFGDWAGGVFKAVIDWFAKLPARLTLIFVQILDNVRVWWTNFTNNISTWVAGVFNTIVNWFIKLPGRILGLFGDVYNNVSTWFTGTFIPNIGTWASNAIKAVVDWFIKLPGKVVTAVGDIIPKLKTFFVELPGKIMDSILSVGKAIIDGVWKGIVNAWQGFWDNVMGFFKGIVKGVKAALGISSPSKVFAGIGSQIVEGLGTGINSSSAAMDALLGQVSGLERAAAAANIATQALGINDFTTNAAATRTVKLDVTVSSPDGTVNGMKQSEIEDILTAQDFVSTLEHMATVG